MEIIIGFVSVITESFSPLTIMCCLFILLLWATAETFINNASRPFRDGCFFYIFGAPNNLANKNKVASNYIKAGDKMPVVCKIDINSALKEKGNNINTLCKEKLLAECVI